MDGHSVIIQAPILYCGAAEVRFLGFHAAEIYFSSDPHFKRVLVGTAMEAYVEGGIAFGAVVPVGEARFLQRSMRAASNARFRGEYSCLEALAHVQDRFRLGERFEVPEKLLDECWLTDSITVDVAQARLRKLLQWYDKLNFAVLEFPVE